MYPVVWNLDLTLTSLTCRKRRVKCDENKPCCGPCTKSERECGYAATIVNSAEVATVGTATVQRPSLSSQGPTSTSILSDIDSQLYTDSPELRFDLSPLTVINSLPSPNSAPFEWYDLLAEDAVNNIQKHNLGFDHPSLSRRQSPIHDSSTLKPQLQSPVECCASKELSPEPWNKQQQISLSEKELVLLQHYIHVVGPILDIFDPIRHFSEHVPRLAVHNAGLLKSLLAVAARHMALHSDTHVNTTTVNSDSTVRNPTASDEAEALVSPYRQLATQYYYDTLHYLSQNLLYPSYTRSSELIATAILISTYEMFYSGGSYSEGGWERHLRGIFWIQRSQDNNGETEDGLRRAAWWAWIRQDMWVAFRENRRTLTIWRPTKRLLDLTPDELATRIVYIAARCVDFAANEKHHDIGIRIEQGNKLLQALNDWYFILPPSYRPIYTRPIAESDMFTPRWIHPPAYAAAIQMYHFARIIVLINQPSKGGMDEFRHRQRVLDESVDTICGIAMMQQEKDLPSACADFQALYAGTSS